MVAERCLSASMPETASGPLPTMDAMIDALADDEAFVPTHINTVPSHDEAVGPVIMELICKALAYGQVLMSLGGYIVKGIAFKCGKTGTSNPKRRWQLQYGQAGLLQLRDTTTTTTTTTTDRCSWWHGSCVFEFGIGLLGDTKHTEPRASRGPLARIH